MEIAVAFFPMKTDRQAAPTGYPSGRNCGILTNYKDL